MAQLIVLLEKDFRNTLKNRYQLPNNVTLPHIQTNIIKRRPKLLKIDFSKGFGNKCDVKILAEDITDSESEELHDSSVLTETKKLKKLNDITEDSFRGGAAQYNVPYNPSKSTNPGKNARQIKRCQEINADEQSCYSEEMKQEMNSDTEAEQEENFVNKEIKKEKKSATEPDPFEDSADDDSDFEDANTKITKSKENLHVLAKRKVTNDTENNHENIRVQEESESDGEYAPDESLDDENLDSDDALDREIERSRSRNKPKNKNGKDLDPKKSALQEVIDNAVRFNCTICDERLKTIAEKRSHTKWHDPKHVVYHTIYRCPDCEYENYHLFQFKLHYQIHNPNAGESLECYKCTECAYKTRRKESFKKHLSYHKVKGAFQCEYCSFSHDHKKNLTIHLRLHNKFLTGILSCDECPYMTKYHSSLKKHQKINHTPEDKKKWIHCNDNECPFKTLELQNLKKHIKCHQLEDGYECPHCSYRSSHACRITEHIKLHYDKGQQIPDYDPKKQTPLYSCTKCSYKTMTKHHLERHAASHVTHKNRLINCADCPFTCKDKIDLINHVKWHNGEGTLKCPWCSFVHNYKPLMTKHKRLHYDDREDYWLKNKGRKAEPRCPICHKLFQGPVHVRIHMTKHQTVDQVENPVMCAHCPYRSKVKGQSFVNHVQCHFKRDGMKCEFCSFRHERLNVMSAHAKWHKKTSIKEEPAGEEIRIKTEIDQQET